MITKQKKILVVDDLPDWRKTLGGLLTDSGYKVEVADSFKTAIDLLKKKTFDLALLDVRLDETDETNTGGLDLAAKIKSFWPSTKIIIITGYQTQEILDRSLKTNNKGEKLVADFIPKTNTEELIKIIDNALAK
jgi:two-component system, NtrC family, response regulator